MAEFNFSKSRKYKLKGKVNFLIETEDLVSDSADYIMLRLESEKTILTNFYKKKSLIPDRFGYLIANVEGEYNIYISGRVNITNNEGENIDFYEQLEKYIINDRLSELNFSSSAFFRIVEKNRESTFHGIYNNLEEVLFYLQSIENGEKKDFFFN